MKEAAEKKKHRVLSDSVLSRLSEYLMTHMGLYFPKRKWGELEGKMIHALDEFPIDDVEDFVSWLLSSPMTKQQIEVLSSHLTVGETYFFREQPAFEILSRDIVPALRKEQGKGKHRIRIWSAGCATGEEPYSIAIQLSRILPDLVDWDITILATDINPRFLEKAEKGLYTEWSFRQAPSWIKEGYFRKIDGNRHMILPHIKEMVTFSYLNLSDDIYPSLLNNTNGMDIIFCRNVLMYFAPEYARTVVGRFHKCLADGGWLFVSPVETSHLLFSSFSHRRFAGYTAYQKTAHPQGQLVTVEPPKTVERIETVYEPYVPARPLPETTIRTLPQSRAKKASVAMPVKSRIETETIDSSSDILRSAAELYQQGNYDDVVSLLTGEINDITNNPKALTLIIRSYANRGNLEEALSWCENALTIDKLNPVTHYLRASIIDEQGDTDRAIRAFKKAIYLEPEFPLAHFALGNLYIRKRDQKQARRYFDNVMKILANNDPDDLVPESEGVTVGRLSEIVESVRIESMQL